MTVRLSRRGRWGLTANALTLEVERLNSAGESILDLTVSNPTSVGLDYPNEQLSEIVAAAAHERYRPDARGMRVAREALARFLSTPLDDVSPDALFLCVSTSEAYSWLFKLLCDAGDDVVCGVPSYPLFQHLADLENVVLRSYDLRFDRRWEIDFGSLRKAVSDRTRAIIAVHPNNPTGSYVSQQEHEEMLSFAIEHDLALISDEVFHDYPLDDSSRGGSFASITSPAATFSLGGLSKLAGLPHWKVAWIRVSTPPTERERVHSALELIADTFLSVSTLAQASLPAVLALVPSIRDQIRRRTRENLVSLVEMTKTIPAMQLLPVEGGWSAVIRVPRLGSDEDLVLSLLRDRGVLLHPGYFFDFPRDGYLVVSLLPEPPTFKDGISRVVEHLGTLIHG